MMIQPTDNQNFDLSDIVYDNKILKLNNKPIQLTDGSKWIVINSVNDKSGLQAIAVVPIKDFLDMKSGNIKEYPNVIFSARGSEPNLDEFYKDWVQTDAGTLGIGASPDKHKKVGTPANHHQFLGFETFVNSTLSDNPIKDFSFTGHSLGGALAQYMAVLTDRNATTFAAAKAYRLLPGDLKKLVDSGYFNNKIVDYRHYYDPVGHVPFGSIIGRQFITESSSINIPIWGHIRGTFMGKFYKGNIRIDTSKGIKGSLDQAELTMTKNMRHLNDLRTKWQGRGVISPSQQIFLDQAEALVTLSAVSNAMKTGLTAVITECQQAIQEAQHLWSSTVNKAQGIAESLNHDEILEALSAGGATKSLMVDKPVTKFEEKMTQAYDLMTSHDATITQLKTGIANLAKFDQEIAQEMASLPI